MDRPLYGMPSCAIATEWATRFLQSTFPYTHSPISRSRPSPASHHPPATMSVHGYRYVIEHMEDDDATTTSVPPWVRLEYAQMLKNAGEHSQVLFTSLSAPSAAALPAQLASAVGEATNVAACEATTTPILDLLATAGPNGSPVPIEKVCLLDPRAPRVLSPADGAPGAFEFFLFGGILGDDPPRDRTGELRKLGFETRHLGSVQMTTDTVSTFAYGWKGTALNDFCRHSESPRSSSMTRSPSTKSPTSYVASPLPNGFRTNRLVRTTQRSDSTTRKASRCRSVRSCLLVPDHFFPCAKRANRA